MAARLVLCAHVSTGSGWATSETASPLAVTSTNCVSTSVLDIESITGGLHGINNRQLLHYALRKDGCVTAARKLQKEGRVRFLGFSTHATTDIIQIGRAH